MLWRCLSVHPPVQTHHFHMITQNVLQLSTLNLVYTFPIRFWGILLVGVRDHDLVTEVTKIKFSFRSVTPMFQCNELEVSTGTHLGWGKMRIYFGVTGVILRIKWSISARGPWGSPNCFRVEVTDVTKVKFSFCIMTANVLELSNWILVRTLV